MLDWILALLGIFVSLEATRMHFMHRRKPQEKPWCDLSMCVNCSKALFSNYGSLVLFPNPVWGIIGYVAILISALLGWQSLLLGLIIAATSISLVFAYLLFVRLRTICLLCLAVYAINLALLILVL